MFKNPMERNERILNLELRLITHINGKTIIDAKLRHKCKDKQVALELIESYVKRSKREKVDA